MGNHFLKNLFEEGTQEVHVNDLIFIYLFLVALGFELKASRPCAG
jgi:hypothetical protein